MILKTLKCRKEGMREKRNVRMPPHTSAQYLHRELTCLAHSFLHLPLFMNAMSSTNTVVHACDVACFLHDNAVILTGHAREEAVHKIIVLEQSGISKKSELTAC